MPYLRVVGVVLALIASAFVGAAGIFATLTGFLAMIGQAEKEAEVVLPLTSTSSSVGLFFVGLVLMAVAGAVIQVGVVGWRPRRAAAGA